ncbi:hypothetical protein [Acetivibrio clariflavus]|uniref:hypothetical protein n=1 Tax=Acetivibrio clariflavus TaxID=288965 RepID=UPI0004846272|nr:hypothetical protein [Acetivibrio clariflavus]
MNRAEIVSKINEFIPVKEAQIVEKVINVDNITFTNVRDRLIGLGKILEENFDDTYYVVNVPAGVANKNTAVVLVRWSEDNISLFAYAKEGLINQHTADKAIERVIEKITK